jgi:hypothetical protein
MAQTQETPMAEAVYAPYLAQSDGGYRIFLKLCF